MSITEPATAITDYILAGETIFLGILILRRCKVPEQFPARLWAFALFTIALGAAAGGTYHGFLQPLGAAAPAVWKITVYAIGATSVLMLIAAVLSTLTGRARQFLIGVAILQFLAYACWMLSHNDFKYVIFDYAPAMGVILLLQLIRLHRGISGAGWIAAGIVISFVAAGIQQSNLNLHPKFNHNDLYHVVQMTAMYLLYRGGLLLKTV